MTMTTVTAIWVMVMLPDCVQFDIQGNNSDDCGSALDNVVTEPTQRDIQGNDNEDCGIALGDNDIVELYCDIQGNGSED